MIKEVVGSTPWPLLTKTNYNEWSLVMKVEMKMRQMWDVARRIEVKFDDDRRALVSLRFY
jgi:hypothetical protein